MTGMLPPVWRFALIAAATLIFCSCSAPRQQASTGAPFASLPNASPPRGAQASAPHPVQPVAWQQEVPNSLPRATVEAVGADPTAVYYIGDASGHTGGHANCPHCANAWRPGMTLPESAWTGVNTEDPSLVAPWAPPGIRRPWPLDEYLCDGGDRDAPVFVRHDFQVKGLDLEDTVAHFDTLDGRTIVEPSNRVCVYAPRFASVRKVRALVATEQHERVDNYERRVLPVVGEEVQIAGGLNLPVQLDQQIVADAPNVFRERTLGIGLRGRQKVTAFQYDFAAYEDFQLIRRGVMHGDEKPRLSNQVQAALVWAEKDRVQVMIDEEVAITESHDLATQEAVTYELPPGKHRLRICKVASTAAARPGEIVEFTLRFDNLGDQEVGNVTILDNLTTRLEYVEGSAQCSLEANFSTSENLGESLQLRWEIIDPLPVGQGGIIRFQCRVR